MEKELLGKGRFGEVYKVTKDDETIALKEIIIEAKNKEKADKFAGFEEELD